ncbi:MAG: malonyl-ACP O-methyltransferase BioC [Proteobacteria bacterium]|nr:malonyl-ACP O-methyltransferase BioC [Pseudomonadota bacterium]
MSPFDLRQIRRAFGRAAKNYTRNAALQRRIEARLLERLEYYSGRPVRILDAGCGPGHGSALLRKRFRSARIIALDLALPMLRQVRPGWRNPLVRVCADARALPMPDASVDVLFSNLCIQWIADLRELFAEFRRVLKPGGYLAFSTFGPDTLHELRSAWSAADAAPHVNRFAHIGEVGDAMIAAGFRDPVLDTEHFIQHYAVAADLMRELKAIGATNADAQRTRGLTGKARFRRVLDAYEGFRRDGRLPATYEVICAHAFGPDAGQPRRTAGGEIATFSVDALRGSRR